LARRAAAPAGLFLLIVAPQVILYTKSGFVDRYLLPLQLAYALAVICLIRRARMHAKATEFLLWPLAVFALCVGGVTAAQGAGIYTRLGKATQSALQAVQSHTTRASVVLIVGDPLSDGECVESLHRYLTCVSGLERLYVLPVPPPRQLTEREQAGLRRIVGLFGGRTHGRLTAEGRRPDCVIVLRSAAHRMPALRRADYAQTRTGLMDVYWRTENVEHRTSNFEH
jgi:hypothetical protein